MGFRELARWQIFSESLANALWRTDTLANLWRMAFGEVTRWRIFNEWFVVN